MHYFNVALQAFFQSEYFVALQTLKVSLIFMNSLNMSNQNSFTSKSSIANLTQDLLVFMKSFYVHIQILCKLEYLAANLALNF